MGESSRRTLEIGDLVEGRYKVLKLLGEGGMGTVFLCEHTLIKRKVAIKVLRPQFASDTTVVERFMNEARAAGTLGHPNIVESTDMGFTHDYVPYIVFEYLEGALLTDEIYRLGGLPHRRAVRIAEQVAAALRAAHDAGIVHRDLKSENVFLTDKDETQDHVKVLDFGISRFMEVDDAHKAMVMGTPEFMAPEQFTTPEAVDGRADIYALGVIMYEMLAARRPFNGATPQELQKRILSEMPTALGRSDVPNALQDLIINRLMAKDRSQRPQSMGEVQMILEQFLTRADGTPIPVPRRRTQPSIQTQNQDIARNSDTIPRPQGMLNTPYPTMDTIQPPMADLAKAMAAKQNGKSKSIYIIAGASLLVGGLGLMYGLKGSSPKDAVASATQSTAMASMPTQQIPTSHEPQKISVELEANVPGARVTFRRHLSQAPERQEVAPIDVVELVEFSAPGYKTERYWITFDRPTHLKAHLVKGAGMEEASEEATLIALGEADAIVMTGTAPKLASNDTNKATTTTTTTTTTPKDTATPAMAAATPAPQMAARRKIGRGSSSEAPEESVKTEAIVQTRTKNNNANIAEGAPAMVTAVPAPPKVEAPVEAPKPAPQPAIAAAQPAAQPAPELARTAPPPTAPVAPVVAAAEPPKTIAPAAFTSMRTSGGAIEPPEIVQTQMMRDEKTKASAVVKVCIDTNGNVTAASMAKSSGYPGYDQKLTEGVHSWHYKPYMLNGKATPACSAVVFAFKLQ